ncbi:hypothetical protein CbuK_2102 [Coxiella burnetii CbuK_Q154]|nr:hypothetical protein CbuK_2102 [Coxiella burnetii CbuK_Q154]EAX33673.1 hypothetical protein A35_10685 [Coxiella burnetii 'MSU Goat Q177']
MSRGEFNFHKDSYLVDSYFIPGVFSETTPITQEDLTRACSEDAKDREKKWNNIRVRLAEVKLMGWLYAHGVDLAKQARILEPISFDERVILPHYFSENIERETEENKTDTPPRNENPRLRVLQRFYAEATPEACLEIFLQFYQEVYIERLQAPSNLGLVGRYNENISPLLDDLERAYQAARNEETKGEELITSQVNFWTLSPRKDSDDSSGDDSSLGRAPAP